MPEPRRLLALAGLLGGILLVEAQAAQAQEAYPVPVCQQTERGYLCSENIDRTYRTPEGRQIRTQTRTTVSCTAAEPAPTVDLFPQASQYPQYPEALQDTVIECAGSPAR